MAGGAAVGSQWPPGAAPAPGGVRAQLSTPGTGADQWTLDVYRRRGSGTSSSVRIPGSIDYCLGVSLTRGEGKKRWRGVTCELSTELALSVHRRGLSLDCGSGGVVLGEPAPPQPTCGLVAGDVPGVSVSADNGLKATAQLSEPFRVRYNRSARILRRSGIDPSRIRELPRTFRVRAFLAFLTTPSTPPGGRTPRLTVTATRADGQALSRTIGGDLFPAPPKRPSLRPVPGAPRVRLAVTGVDGRLWRSTAWLSVDGGLCANARLAGTARRLRSGGCNNYRSLIDTLGGGPQAYTGTPGRARRRTYPVYGFVRAQAVALTLIDRRGRRWKADLSRVFTTIRLHGRARRVRAFLAAVQGPPPSPRRSLEFESRLSNGYVESVGGGRSPAVRD